MTHGYPNLLEHVQEDTNLGPCEKETAFRFAKDLDYFEGYTAEAGLARRLLAHSYVEIPGVTILDGDARRDVAPEDVSGDVPIVGVRVKAPVGLLSVKSTPRRASGHASVVTQRVFDEGTADE